MDNEIATIDEASKMTNQLEKPKLTGLGERLKNTRESMQLTQKEAAARLYLNPKILEIMEKEAFLDGPPLTFMRGYLRSYARLLNLPDSEIKTAIDALELSSIPVTQIAPKLQANPIYRGDRYLRWFTYLIVLTLISLVVLWWSSHSKYVTTETPSTNPLPAAATSTETTETMALAPDGNADANKSSPTEPATGTTAQETTTPPAEPTATSSEPAANTPPALPPTQSSIAPLSAATADPAVNSDPAATAEATPAPIKKPAATHRKRHRRQHYQHIENMEIPEPE